MESGSSEKGVLISEEAQTFLKMLSVVPIDHNHRYLIAPGNYDYVITHLQVENSPLFWYITHKLRYNLFESLILTVDVPYIWRTESADGIANLLVSRIRALDTESSVHRQTRELAKRLGPHQRATCDISAGTKLCPDHSFGIQDSYIPGLIFEFGKQDSFWGVGGLKHKAETWLKGKNNWLTNKVIAWEIGAEKGIWMSVFETKRSLHYGGWFPELVLDREELEDEEGYTYPGELMIELADMIAFGTLHDLPLANKGRGIWITYREIVDLVREVRGRKETTTT